MAQLPAGHPEKPQGEHGIALLERMNGGSHEELALWGLDLTDIPASCRALDIGCGGGANLQRILERAPQGHATGIDYSPLSVQKSTALNDKAIAAGRCAVLEGNASELPFPNESFDLITAFETVYYWDLPTAFAEAKRVLAPDGVFLICNEDNGLDPERLALAALIPGMTMYTMNTLEDALTDAGFEIVSKAQVHEKGFIALLAKHSKSE